MHKPMKVNYCSCGGHAVEENRKTTFASAMVMPLYEYAIKCDKCGRRTNWRFTFDEALEEWNDRTSKLPPVWAMR